MSNLTESVAEYEIRVLNGGSYGLAVVSASKASSGNKPPAIETVSATATDKLSVCGVSCAKTVTQPINANNTKIYFKNTILWFKKQAAKVSRFFANTINVLIRFFKTDTLS